MNTPMLARYEQAHALLKSRTSNDYVRNDTVHPHWIGYDDGPGSDSFWYRRQTAVGKEYRLVNIHIESNDPAFDHALLAGLLTEALLDVQASASDKNRIPEQVVNPLDLPLKAIVISAVEQGAPLQIQFEAMERHWVFEPEKSTLKEISANRSSGFISPDGSKSAFVREHNIWVRDLSSGEEQQLTHNGTENCLNGEGSFGVVADTLSWSANSQQLLFAQVDQQETRVKSHINHVPLDGGLEPEYTETKVTFPANKPIGGYRLFVANLCTGENLNADYPTIPEMFSGFTVEGFLTSNLAWWSADCQRVYFVDSSQDVRTIRVVEWDIPTGNTRVVFEETDEIAVRLRHDMQVFPIIAPLRETDELIWFSERSGWGHLYLYDLNTGDLKHQITGASKDPSGNNSWLVHSILHVDTERRELLIESAARDPDVNPYYRDVCKVNIDSGSLTPLLSGNYEHRVYQPIDGVTMVYMGENFGVRSNIEIKRHHCSGVSPLGEYLLVTRSRVDAIPESLLIDRDGREILTVETADTSDLPADWQWPEPVKLTAADGETDIYAVVFRPPGFSEGLSYPVVDFSSSTRGFCNLPTGSFINTMWMGHPYYLAAAMASLGFIVVCIAGRGTTGREKTFYTHHYGDHAYTSDFNDRIAGIRQLAERYPYMDLNRVGINGSENPINNTIYASLMYSDFYKVTVLHCMTDPRFMLAQRRTTEVAMSESTPPRTPYPEDCVDSFSGKLLLIQGLGPIAFPTPTFRLVDALTKANKDVDMLLVPQMNNTITPYTLRREWDYLVTHLLGETPPEQFLLTVD